MLSTMHVMVWRSQARLYTDHHLNWPDTPWLLWNAAYKCLLKRVNALHDYTSFCLILLPVNASMVNCQDELSLHLLQEEASPPGVHYQGSCCFPSPPNRIDGPGAWAERGIGCLVAVWLRLMSWACCCFRALFLASCLGIVQGWPLCSHVFLGGLRGYVPLSHLSFIMRRRTACLWVCVPQVPSRHSRVAYCCTCFPAFHTHMFEMCVQVLEVLSSVFILFK